MVTVETWNYDSVKFVIVATASAPTNADLNVSLNNIDFQFINTDHFVLAKTIIINPARVILNDFKSIFNNSNSMNIEYKLYVPKTVNLKIENKYGDIYANSLSGNISITLSYGKLKMNQIDGQLTLNLNYVDNAEIEKATHCKAALSFSNVLLKHVASLEMNSSFSKIDINQVDDIQLQSSNDEISIGEIKTAECNAKFSKLNIGYLGNSFIGDTKFGTITFKKPASSFSKINLGSKYTDVNIFFDEESVGFDLEIENRKTRILYPRMFNLKEELINQKENSYRTTGHIGKQSNSKIFIDANCGNINIKMR
jgi:hypothetical protein